MTWGIERDRDGKPMRMWWMGDAEVTAASAEIPKGWPFDETFRILLRRKTLPWR